MWFGVTGTHSGVYQGLTPTGKAITIRVVSLYRVVDGKVVEREAVYDRMECYTQLKMIE